MNTHGYQLGGFNIVVDGNSGSIHVCDELTFDIIALRVDNDAERSLALFAEKHMDVPDADLQAALSEVDELVTQGKLFSAPIDLTPPIEDTPVPAVKALCLNVSHACNLRCTYCFAGKTNGDGELMSFQTGKAALDFLIANSADRRNLEVDFFGGEPLLNWSVVKQLVEYARSVEGAANKNFRFTFTTNGILLDDEVLEYANREFQTVVLSLDGREPTHDRFRKQPDGGGSYSSIAGKIQRFVEKRVGEYYIRATYTRENLDFLKDLLHLRSLGFKNLSIEPVVCAEAEPYSIRESDLPVIFSQYEQLAEHLSENPDAFSFYHFMLDLESGPCLNKRIAGCGSGSEYMAVTPDGSLYPCHQFVGDTGYIMGNVYSGVSRPDIAERFAHNNILTKPECQPCWAKVWCAGGCAANSYHSTGDPAGVYKIGCELFKKRLECAIAIKVSELVKEQN
ncbi:MAG: thioether cross-link-forming SCIFF peptide maturase [Oscillospiraceae bacterium]|jgi:uncharacterized protein|nr:thioether cross-link-forming SCIFF peptide maturase [Oscillospiraceae bacterium]